MQRFDLNSIEAVCSFDTWCSGKADLEAPWGLFMALSVHPEQDVVRIQLSSLNGVAGISRGLDLSCLKLRLCRNTLYCQ